MVMLGTSLPCILDATQNYALSHLFFVLNCYCSGQSSTFTEPKTEVFCLIIKSAQIICYSRLTCLLLPVGTPADSFSQINSFFIILLETAWSTESISIVKLKQHHCTTERQKQLCNGLYFVLKYFARSISRLLSTLPEEEERNSDMLSIQQAYIRAPAAVL